MVPNLHEKQCSWLSAAGAKVVTSADDLLLLSVIDMGRLNQSLSTSSCCFTKQAKVEVAGKTWVEIMLLCVFGG